MGDLGLPALISHDRIAVELGEMHARFRTVEFLERAIPHAHHRFELLLRPLAPGADVGLIAAHLKAGSEIIIHPDGRIDATSDGLRPVPVRPNARLHQTFRVHVTWRGYPALPLVHVVSPVIDFRSSKVEHLLDGPPFAHPETTMDARLPQQALCYVAPNLVSWKHGVDTAASLMPDVVTWLASFLLEHHAGVPWVVEGAPHDPATLFLTVQPGDSCPCYSGRAFTDCHRLEWRDVYLTSVIRRQGSRQPNVDT